MATIPADALKEPVLSGKQIVQGAGFAIVAVRGFFRPALLRRRGTDFPKLFSDVILLGVLATILDVFGRYCFHPTYCLINSGTCHV